MRLMEVSRREKMLCSGRTFREIDGSVEEGEDVCNGRTFREIDGSVEEGDDAVQWEDVQGD